MTIGRGRCLDDNRFQTIMILYGHKKANLDRLVTPVVRDRHPRSRGWGYDHAEPHRLIVS
jgi:hypothetical protein